MYASLNIAAAGCQQIRQPSLQLSIRPMPGPITSTRSTS